MLERGNRGLGRQALGGEGSTLQEMSEQDRIETNRVRDLNIDGHSKIDSCQFHQRRPYSKNMHNFSIQLQAFFSLFKWLLYPNRLPISCMLAGEAADLALLQ